MQHDQDLSKRLDQNTCLQLKSADLLMDVAELRRQAGLARERFQAARSRVLELKRRFELLKQVPRAAPPAMDRIIPMENDPTDPTA